MKFLRVTNRSLKLIKEEKSPLYLREAEIEWLEGNKPYSNIYKDLFFSNDGAFEECEHVYIRGNKLQERWRNLGVGQQFSIGELGFGAGLNFLHSWRKWLEYAPKEAQLNYFYSTEN